MEVVQLQEGRAQPLQHPVGLLQLCQPSLPVLVRGQPLHSNLDLSLDHVQVHFDRAVVSTLGTNKLLLLLSHQITLTLDFGNVLEMINDYSILISCCQPEL